MEKGCWFLDARLAIKLSSIKSFMSIGDST